MTKCKTSWCKRQADPEEQGLCFNCAESIREANIELAIQRREEREAEEYNG